MTNSFFMLTSLFHTPGAFCSVENVGLDYFDGWKLVEDLYKKRAKIINLSMHFYCSG